MRVTPLFLISFFFLVVSSPLLAETTCGESCAGGWSDCNYGSKDCTYCDPVDQICKDCCDQTSCPNSNGCDFIGSGQCQNKDTLVCISEVPKQSRSLLVLGFGLLALVLGGGTLGYKRVRSTKRPSL